VCAFYKRNPVEPCLTASFTCEAERLCCLIAASCGGFALLCFQPEAIHPCDLPSGNPQPAQFALCRHSPEHDAAPLMKVGVIVSNPGEDETFILGIWVATKVRSSSSSGMGKGCGPRGCGLLCLRPSWIKLSMADSVPVHGLTCLCCSV